MGAATGTGPSENTCPCSALLCSVRRATVSLLWGWDKCNWASRKKTWRDVGKVVRHMQIEPNIGMLLFTCDKTMG